MVEAVYTGSGHRRQSLTVREEARRVARGIDLMRQLVAGDGLRYQGLYISPDEVRVLRNAVATVTG